MEVKTRNRAELKSYFVKNSIPTESNFAELIDGILNQKDDGLVKLANTPLSIEAVGDDASTKNAINLYRKIDDEKPDWTINLNPRSDPNKPETAKLGFNISDGEGNNRLFIDRASGHIGVGTIEPDSPLHIHSSTEHRGLKISANGKSTPIFLHVAPGDYGYLSLGGDTMLRGNGKHSSFDGNVGIGTTSPQDKLDIHGVLRFNSNASTRIYGDTRAARDTVVLRGKWNELEVKGRVIDWTGSNLHIGYDNDHSNNYIEIGRKVGYTRFLSGGGAAETMRITNSNVGIGTTNPGAKLDVSGSGANQCCAPVPPTISLAEASNTVGRQAWLQFHNAGEAEAYIRLAGGGPAGSGREGQRRLEIGDNQAVKTSLVVEGNIGIGTTAPGAKLHVEGTDILLKNANPGSSLHVRTDGNGNAFINNMNNFVGNASTGNKLLVITGQNGILFRYGNSGSSGADAMTIGANGDIWVSGRIQQQNWRGATFQNGWINYSNTYNSAGYFKDSLGIVHLRGLVKNGAIGAVIFTLPAGYRPPKQELHVVCTYRDTSGRVDVKTNGQVWASTGSNLWISLDGITFRAA